MEYYKNAYDSGLRLIANNEIKIERYEAVEYNVFKKNPLGKQTINPLDLTCRVSMDGRVLKEVLVEQVVDDINKTNVDKIRRRGDIDGI